MKAESVRHAAERRVVVDSNVWISAALMQTGTPAKLVRHVLEHGLPVFSPTTFAELETRLWRPKFDRYLSMELRGRILHDLKAAAYWVDALPTSAVPRYCRDADDDKFIQTALAAQAPWLVTGDQDLLEAPAVAGLCVLTPMAALQAPGFCGFSMDDKP
ncbi:MAG: putative toxin-antitoxin system toxin component, PIN family [Methylococcaceae bacterium]|nr:MAG: putative toxin-antitoxin system toxin component, PIN family [Methylococcaceae bacterium]